MVRLALLAYPLLLVPFALAACAPRFAAEEVSRPLTQPTEPVLAEEQAAPVLPGRKPFFEQAASMAAPVAAVAAAPALPPLPPRRPAFPRVEPAALAGIGPEETLALLGRPRHARSVGGASLWVYEHEACRLTLHFNFSIRENALRATRYDISSELDGGLPESMCLHFLAAGLQSQLAAREVLL